VLIKSLDAPIIMAGVTIFAVISWWFTPTDAWLSKKHSSHSEEADRSAGEEITGDSKNVDASR
jgi:hypothetical protein